LISTTAAFTRTINSSNSTGPATFDAAQATNKPNSDGSLEVIYDHVEI
jgi:hypothetical protein